MDFFSSPYFLLAAVAVALLVALHQVRQYMTFRKQIRERSAATGETVRSTDFPTGRRLSLLVPVAICLGVAVWILVKPDIVTDPAAYLALVAILAILFSSSFVTSNMTQRLYYTDSGFFIKERFVPFAELQKLSHGGSKADSIQLRDGSQFPIPRRQMEALEALRSEKVFKLPGKGKK